MKVVGSFYASIDIGSYETKLVIASYTDNDTFKIEHLASVKTLGVNRGEIIGLNSFIQSLTKLITPYKNKINSLNINLSSLSFDGIKTSGTIDLNNIVNAENINSAIRHSPDYKLAIENHKLTFCYPYNFKLGPLKETTNPIGAKTSYLEVFYYLATINTSFVNSIYQAFGDIGLHINKTIISSIAKAYFALNNEQKRSGVCLLDIGHHTCDVLVFKNNTLIISKTLDFGGGDINENIAYHYDCDQEEAKKLKEQYGFADKQGVTEEFVSFNQFGEQKFLSNYQLSDVICESIDDFIARLKPVIKDIVLTSGFVVSGECVNIKNFLPFLRNKLKNKVNKIYINEELLDKNNLICYENIDKISKYKLALSLLVYKENTDYLKEIHQQEENVSVFKSGLNKLKTKIKSWEKQ